MWLLILAYSAVVATVLWYVKAENDRYMLKLLSLILWGATVMVFVDHLVGYLTEGGEFVEVSLEATLVGLFMLLTALVIWEVILLIKDPKGVIRKIR